MLPEKWCILVTPKTSLAIYTWLNEHKQTDVDYLKNRKHIDDTSYVYYPAVNGRHQYNQVDFGYSLITFDQFSREFLNPSEVILYNFKLLQNFNIQ